jgi:hypothetical protein
MKNGILFVLLILAMTSAGVAQQSSNANPNSVSAADGHSRDPRFEIDVEAGIGFPRLTRGPLSLSVPLSLNPPAETYRTIKKYQNYSLDFEYLIYAGISVGVGYEFMTTEANGVLYSYKRYYDRPFEVNVRNHGVFLLIDKRWKLIKKPLGIDLHARVKTGEYFSYFKFTSPQWNYTAGFPSYDLGPAPEIRQSWDHRKWGTEGTVGLSWVANRHLAVGVNGGYRWLKINDYDVSLISYGYGSGLADFSGPIVRFRLSTRF